VPDRELVEMDQGFEPSGISHSYALGWEVFQNLYQHQRADLLMKAIAVIEQRPDLGCPRVVGRVGRHLRQDLVDGVLPLRKKRIAIH
jgi:hypothetical protein